MIGLFDTLFDDPRLFLILLVAFVVSFVAGLSFHEFAHALVGDRLGDPTPVRQGRLTLNPRHHLDPLGTIFLLFAGFGWAKPVRVNPYNLKFGPKVGMALVAVAGPLSNFLLAAAFAAPLRTDALPFHETIIFRGIRFALIAPGSWGPANYLAALLFFIVLINVTLGVFNLLPIPPMDGSRVAMLLPGDLGEFFRRMEQQGWGFGILMLLLLLPLFTGGQVNVIGWLLET